MFRWPHRQFARLVDLSLERLLGRPPNLALGARRPGPGAGGERVHCHVHVLGLIDDHPSRRWHRQRCPCAVLCTSTI